MTTAKKRPAGAHTVTPHLVAEGAEGAARAIAFYEKAFGAKEESRVDPKDYFAEMQKLPSAMPPKEARP